jgi:hypothetical protein
MIKAKESKEGKFKIESFLLPNSRQLSPWYIFYDRGGVHAMQQINLTPLHTSYTKVPKLALSAP